MAVVMTVEQTLDPQRSTADYAGERITDIGVVIPKTGPIYSNIDKIKNYRSMAEARPTAERSERQAANGTEATQTPDEGAEIMDPKDVQPSAVISQLPGFIRRHSSKTPNENRKSVPELERRQSHPSVTVSEHARLSQEVKVLARPSLDRGSSAANPKRVSVVNGDFISEDPDISDELKRMRDSEKAKRENKRRMKELQDGERVLVGQRVSEGHANYVMAYDMLTGIRVAVSRCAQVPHRLTDADFTATKKLAFDLSGSEITPSSKYDFKFKDYAPEVFRDLRRLFKLDAADYLVSLTAKYILSEQGSPGKSGSFFYYSRDFKFIIKTIHHSEHRQLRTALREYHAYVRDNPNTLISQIYGLHRLKMPWGRDAKVHKVHFLVMNNIFPPFLKMHKQFDLKGSTYGRVMDVPRALAQGKTNIVMKDVNWLDQNEKLLLGPTKRKTFLTQLRKDVRFLERLRIMDYSLLVGIHSLDAAAAETEPLVNLSDNRRMLTAEDVAALEEEGGIVATNEQDEHEPFVYYVGIIDCLTHYSWIKRLETIFRSIGHKKDTISAIPPIDYGERFLAFITDGVSGATV
ncbi:unnamed protein product [Kuraishia capsulata CBS 1993]|uniref:1-phosphatidylinositol-4-phosphate 5-kinase n=1 Tax=Kuraishia capsulata CBS 1993 TaxID=1382522 RepID=W6MN15_9ASCO|nr:uncharacterized protein KUCA_T00003607001 [Kuraishia capsulata CBS 1993]CDK27628.1 unnamed protein product [Kuraishia capsulata CBS 1993]